MKYSTEHSALIKVFNFPLKGYSIEREEDYKKVVCGPAYLDFTPRTMPGLREKNIENALVWLSKKLFEYIHAETVDFDSWHTATCEDFCDLIRSLHKEIPYGKAQKIVNMSFKYLYCFDDSQRYSHKFSKCHMALDSYTLEWFVRYVLNDEEHKHIKKTQIYENSWSKLICGKNNDEEYSYLWIQRLIKRHLLSDRNTTYVDELENKLSPFQAEFYIWRDMQLHIAMEGLYAKFCNDKREKATFKKMCISEKAAALQESLESLI